MGRRKMKGGGDAELADPNFKNSALISLLFELNIDKNSSFCVLANFNPSTIKSLIRGLFGSFV